METFRRLTLARAQALSQAAIVVAIVVMAVVALVAVNSGRLDAVAAAEKASAEVRDMQAHHGCTDRLASGASSANTDALIGLVTYVRELSSPAGNPAVVDWDGILARVAEAQAAQDATDLNCPDN